MDTLDINRSYETRNAVIGDAKLTVAALAGELSAKTGGARKRPEVLEEIKKGKEAFLAKFRPWLESDETPINPYRVFGDLMKVLDPMGVQIKFVDFCNLDALNQAVIDAKPGALLMETITNPILRVAEVDRIAQLAKSAGAALIVRTARDLLPDSFAFGGGEP